MPIANLTFESLNRVLYRLCLEAGEEILGFYPGAGDLDVQLKADASPITAADTAAHLVVAAGLRKLSPEIPILSEESAAVPWLERKKWSRFWLVDPLDGTREFLDRNDEFTINIALIENGEPVYGMVHVPVDRVAFAGQSGAGAVKIQNHVASSIRSRRVDNGTIRVLTSRRYRGAELDRCIESLEHQFSGIEREYHGSALKFCYLAEGTADFYPRLSPCSEWDTAAGHAVLRAAGGEVLNREFAPLTYNQSESLLNPHFYAVGDAGGDWADWVHHF